MKQGTKVHRILEEQVHKIVPVQTESKEDYYGLRIWNTIQGLRTLRETGMTRELEVWGVVEGQVVNGVIDEVSYLCPDPEYEDALEKSKVEEVKNALPAGQLTLDNFLGSQQKKETGLDWIEPQALERKIYISDVKTRGVKSVPAGASLRPTWMQLMLYRKLLESLALNTVDAETIFARYDLAPLAPFTETFMRDVGGLDASQRTNGEDDDGPPSSFQINEFASHNNLLALWSLMISEFSESMGLFSDVLRAEFRYSQTGEVIGSEVFTYSSTKIDEYIADELAWWKGDRAAKGVEIEEAFKCRMCQFADQCTWRKNKVEEAIEKHRLRAASRLKSAV